MSKEISPEPMTENIQLVNQLFEAAKSEDWDLVDSKIVPDLKNIPIGNDLVGSLLNRVNDEDANIRDAVATGLTALNITDGNLLGKAIDQMIFMAANDESMFPAGRAIVFLSGFKDREEFKPKIDETLVKFTDRVDKLGWRDELIENIPQLESVL